MKRPYVHLLTDGLLAAAGLSLLATGLLIEFVLPPRSGGAEVWGWTRHEWGQWHFWSAVGVLALLLIHLALNWAWVCSVVGRLCGGVGGKPVRWRRVAAGAGSLIVVVGLLAGFLLAANASVVDGQGRGEGRGARHGQR